LLLDTVVLVRLLKRDARTISHVQTHQTRSRKSFFYSSISIWEIGNKLFVNRLEISCRLSDVGASLDAFGLTLMEVGLDHIVRAQDFNHPDPYDRLLLAQADLAGLPLLTTDQALLGFRQAIEL
jgi:PIN domain nuclease of toxin-antitoxin system